MTRYCVSYDVYLGFCVVEIGTSKMIFAGSIEDCNRKCIELNGGVAI